MTAISAIVLCGGRSQRMGQSKAWLELAGMPLLLRTVQTLAAVADRVIIAAAPEQQLPALPTNVLVARDPSPNEGPLAAFAAALSQIDDSTQSVFLTGCDLPFLTADVVRYVAGRMGEASAAVPYVDGRWHPLLAVYRSDVRPIAERLISDGRRRMIDLIEAIDVVRIDPAELRTVDPALRSLRNVNTPEDYAAALRDAR